MLFIIGKLSTLINNLSRFSEVDFRCAKEFASFPYTRTIIWSESDIVGQRRTPMDA